MLATAMPLRWTESVQAATATIQADASRSGWYQDEPALQPGQVALNGTALFDRPVTGQVYASPLVDTSGATSSMLVVTEANQVDWLDPVSGAITNTLDLSLPANGGEVPFNAAIAPVNCSDLAPQVGITGTPVIDTSVTPHVAYFVAKSYVSGSSTTGQLRLHAIDLSTHRERGGFPVQISGSASNVPGALFDATFEHQRTALAVVGQSVVMGFSGHCDHGPYAGWIAAVNRNGGAGALTSLWVDAPTVDPAGNANGWGGIWMSGGGPAVDPGTGDAYVMTGNGAIPAGAVRGSSPPSQLGESVVRLRVDAGGHIAPVSFFMPNNANALNVSDVDLGSGAPTALPDSFGTASHRHLLVGGGKQGVLYVLDRDNLGGYTGDPSIPNADLQELGPFAPMYGKVAVWGGDGGYLYSGFNGQLVGGTTSFFAYQRSVSASGSPQFAVAGTSTNQPIGFAAPPVVTSHNSDIGSAVVWVEGYDSLAGGHPRLLAFESVPESGTLKLLHSFDLSSGGTQIAQKLSTPTVDGGRIYLTTRNAGTPQSAVGHVRAFGIAGAAPLSTQPLAFGTVPKEGSTTQVATLTATTPVTVSSVGLDSGSGYTTNPAYSVDPATTSPTLPAHLDVGQTLSVPVAITPANDPQRSAGTKTGVLAVITDQGQAGVGLSAVSQPSVGQLQLGSASYDFGLRANGSASQQSFSLTNAGDMPVSIGSVSGLSGPLSASGIGAGTLIGPLQSVSVTVSYAPATTSQVAQTLTISGSDGGGGSTSAALSLTGSSAPPGHLVISPLSVSAGTVVVGQTSSASFTVGNTGGVPVTITVSKPPASNGFVASSSLPEGSAVAPGQTLTETVAFAPTQPGAASAAWEITGNDGGARQSVSLNGTGFTPCPSPAATPPYGALYAVDGYGNLRCGGGSPTVVDAPSWPGWDIARAVALLPGGKGGDVLDGFGGVHPFGGAPILGGYPYWPGFSIARDLVLQPGGQGGYVLDGWGGVHPFGSAPAVTNYPYWPGWDIARRIVLRADGVSGYVLDGWGGIHPFGVAGDVPPSVGLGAYWPGWDIARSIVLRPDGVSGYTLDGWGGIHPFGGAPVVGGYAYWPGWDIARAMVLLPNDPTSGYTSDGWGGIHPFGSAPAEPVSGYTPGLDIVRGMAIR